MSQVYLAWQDPETRRWFPVGRLSRNEGRYQFVYTLGAKQSTRFIPFGRMRDLESIYESEELFPLFANRLISKSRPEYKDFLDWLSVVGGEGDDPLALLALTGGRRETDSLLVFAKPRPSSDGFYDSSFFCQGIRHIPNAVAVVDDLEPGTRLALMPDPQNPKDRCALALRSFEPPALLGYCPRYLATDFLELLQNDPEATLVVAKKVNHRAPVQLRLLCRIRSPWPAGFMPCSGEAFEPIPLGSRTDLALAAS